MFRAAVTASFILGAISLIVLAFWVRPKATDRWLRSFILLGYLWFIWIGVLNVTWYWMQGTSEQHIDIFAQLSGVFWILVPTYAFACYWGPPKIFVRFYFYLKNKRDQGRLQF